MSTKQITIRLPEARVEALKGAARAQHRSLAQQVEHQLAAADGVPDAPISPHKSLDVLLGRSADTPLVEDCVTTDDPPKHDLAAQVRTLGADSLLPDRAAAPVGSLLKSGKAGGKQ